MKGIMLACLGIAFITILAPRHLMLEFLPVYFKFLAIGIAARLIYIFLPDQQRVLNIKDKLITIYNNELSVEQKLYVNVCILVLITTLMSWLSDGTTLVTTWLTLAALFALYVAVRDILRWYVSLSKTVLGKAAIALAFIATSNLSFAMARQIIAQVILATPTNFIYTNLLIAILMIPVLMIFAGATIVVIGTVLSSAVIMLSTLPKVPGLKTWLFAGTLTESNINYVFVTRLFQIGFYVLLGAAIWGIGKSNLSQYEAQISSWIPSMIYHLDMYPGRECALAKGEKLAPLGDAKFLVAEKSDQNAISFKPLIKCDEAP